MSFVHERWINEFYPGRPAFHKRVHVIRDTTYRQSISWAGFFSWKHRRNHVDNFKHFFTDYHKEDYEIDLVINQGLEDKNIGIEPSFKFVYHEDLYEFYDYVGYDRHSKTFKR